MRRTRSTVWNIGRSPSCCSRWRGADAGEELVNAERLSHIIIGAEIEFLDLAGLVSAAGQHDDRDGRLAFPHLADDFEPVDSGQAEVQHDEVGGASANLGERRFAGLLLDDVLAFGPQTGAQKPPDGRLVVDDDTQWRSRAHFAAATFG
jgi:hypothetical protein